MFASKNGKSFHSMQFLSVHFLRAAFLTVVFFLLVLFLAGCYVTRAAFEQSKILLAREPISEILEHQDGSDAETTHKLRLVLAARTFGEKLGFNAGSAFTQYTKIEGPAATWVVMASKKDSFKLMTWWFPFVGTVPYKGFFDQEEAIKLAKELEADGNTEALVRGADAFSTLGWFNDPVLSPMLQRDDVSIVNTVLHELFHRTLWIPGQVDFNESLANFVGLEGAIQFYSMIHENCAAGEIDSRYETACLDAEKNLEKARSDREFALELSHESEHAFQALEKHYNSEKSSQEKISERDEIYKESLSKLIAKYPQIQVIQRLHNAKLMEIRLYHKNLSDFETLFFKSEKNWGVFISALKEFIDKDPWQSLENLNNAGKGQIVERSLS